MGRHAAPWRWRGVMSSVSAVPALASSAARAQRMVGALPVAVAGAAAPCVQTFTRASLHGAGTKAMCVCVYMCVNHKPKNSCSSIWLN